jgi:parallel beta-helix repeat protein
MTGFTISGPEGCPNCGLAVIGGASLDLSFTTIRGIRDTSISGCSVDGGTAIIVYQSSDANISNVIITDYSNHAIAVMGANSTARILENSITGYGEPHGIGQVGVLVEGGAAAKIRGNRISNNICNDPIGCGPDLVNQGQSCGIFTYNAGAPTEIEENTVFRNDVGIYLYASNGCRTLSHNTLINNRFFGIIIQNGINTTSHNTITGGAVGEAVVADSSNSTGTFRHDTITETTSQETQEITSPGFIARAIIRR